MKKHIFIIYIIFISLLLSPFAQTKDRPTIALVLGGGGARGMAHIGVLKILEQYNIPIDYIVGTSMGAIVGAAYATGMSPDELEEIMVSTNWKKIFDDVPSLKNLDFRQKTENRLYLNLEMGIKDGEIVLPTGFVAGQKLDFLLRELAPLEEAESFENFAIPFKCIATNVATGEPVILEDGNLVESIRASMAVAGAFTPVHMNGEVLVDGGYTKNLPIDIAIESWNPDIIIAVNVGTPLMPADELKNFMDYSAQVTNILFRYTTNEQIKILKPKDILIEPDLGNTSVAAFDQGKTIIAQGEEMTVRIREELKQYSVSNEEFKTFLIKQRKGTSKDLIIDFIKIAPTKTDFGKQITARIKTKIGKPLNMKTLKNDLTRIYTMGSFEVVDFNIITDNGKTGLLIIPIEKPWGPNYFKVGLQAHTQLKDDSSFNAFALYKRLNLNKLGGEFRFQPIIGYNIGFNTDFYQPLDAADTFFINPRAHIIKNTQDIYDGNDRIARYRTWDFSGGIIGGINFTTYARIFAGYKGGVTNADNYIGQNFPDGNITKSAIVASAQYDTFDAAYFPKNGTLANLDLYWSLKSLGAKETYSKLSMDITSAKTFKDKHTFIASGKLGINLNNTIPFYDEYTLGGFLNMTGYPIDKLRGQNVGYATLIYYYRLKKFAFASSVLNNIYIGGSLETGNAWTDKKKMSFSKLHYGGTVFVGLDTLIGPIYVGYGIADRADNGELFLHLGQRF